MDILEKHAHFLPLIGAVSDSSTSTTKPTTLLAAKRQTQVAWFWGDQLSTYLALSPP